MTATSEASCPSFLHETLRARPPWVVTRQVTNQRHQYVPRAAIRFEDGLVHGRHAC